MLDKLKYSYRRRTWIDLLVIALLVDLVTIIHYSNYQYAVNFHVLLQFGYYIPVIYAAMRFGPVGGVGVGLLITLLSLPHLAHFRTIDRAAWYTQWVEILSINAMGWLTGFLIRQERRATRQYQQALQVQGELLEKLRIEGEQRAQLEAEIRQTERLTALGHLSAGLAHEIRNPLGVIQATAQLLAQERSEDQVVGEYCRVLQEECERLNRLVSQFLDFARPKEPNRQRVTIKQILDNGLALVQTFLRQHKISLEISLNGVESEQVEVDPDQMKQVVLNILLNAIEAQKKEGTIFLEGIRLKGFVGIAVNDQGSGIQPDILSQIYDPFFTTKDKGTGLGLSIVHRILDQNGGKISVINLPQSGTRVEILLPIPNV
ncbi:MAG: ATP-binding protein [Desulfitobacteriaceae bacterium]